MEQVCRLEGDRLAVGQADALEDDEGFAGARLQVVGHFGIGGLQLGDQHAVLGAQAARRHILGKRGQLAQILVDLRAGDIGTFPHLPLGQAVLLEQLQRLARGHP